MTYVLQRHDRRNKWGHNFKDGACVECGLTKAAWVARYRNGQ